MGAEGSKAKGTRALLLGTLLTTFFLLAAQAQAAPTHPRKESLDITGLNHACGVAVDTKGDLYASSAGESKIKVYDPTHKLLTEIADVNTPCGLAVTTTGALYVSERATGEVVRFKPNAYPFSGTPTYGSREVIDSSGKARGIAVDRFDNRLYVAEGTKIALYKSDGSFEANIGEGVLTEASGVAAYTYSGGTITDRFLWVADAAGLAEDKLLLFAAAPGAEASSLALRREVSGAATPDGSFGFGSAGAYLAADPGNRSGEKCVAVGEQACSAGHLFLYDAAHKALDELDASGEYLDRTAFAGFADAEPTAMAIDRSGGSGDGTLYVSAGASTGAKAFAFASLKQPSRATLAEPISHELVNVKAVATDSYGNVYAAADSLIHVYDPKGTEIAELEDEHIARDLAVDSACNVYARDEEVELNEKEEAVAGVAYYEPSDCPPEPATTYTRHEVTTSEDFPAKEKDLRSIAINPGPGAGKDRLFLASNGVTRLYKSAAQGSEAIDKEFGKGLVPGIVHLSVAVDGKRGVVYISVNNSGIFALNEAGTKLLRRFDVKGTPSGKTGANPFLAVDQANGHVIEYDGVTKGVHEYDAAGSFVAEFGAFTEGLTRDYRVAIDSACATHEPPLDETTTPTCKEFDPANGNAYVAFDDSNLSHPPYDVTAFGGLKYPDGVPPEEQELSVEKTGTGSGKVTSSPTGIDCGSTCSTEVEEETKVTLTATAGGSSTFAKWSGCDAEPSATECEVTMSEERKVTAEFEPPPGEEELKTVIEPPGSGIVTSSPAGIECPAGLNGSCSAKFGTGVEILLKAKANNGFEFIGWSGCDSEPSFAECEVAMDEDKEVVAEFDVVHPLLSVTISGNGSGEITSEPPGIECPSECSAKFELSDDVILTAKEDPGSGFIGWTGCDAEPSPTQCEVAMSAGGEEVTASFIALPQAIVKPAQPILYHEATLQGEVDTAELETEYRFEYLTEKEYDENGETLQGAKYTPTGTLALGKGLTAVEAPLTGLEEGTEYRFRLRAMNSAGSAEDEGVFETLERGAAQSCPNAEYRIGLSAALSDCRAYELVTPAQTNGLTPSAVGDGNTQSGGFSNWLTVQRGSSAGERLSYFTEGTLPGFEGNGRLDGYRAERELGEHPVGGWQSTLISPNYRQASSGGFKNSPLQHGIAADQLYSVWETHPGEESFPGETLPLGVYLGTPTGFEPFGRGSLGDDPGAFSRYVSAGGTHVIFASDAHLEPEAPPATIEAIYDREQGAASATVVSIPPPGASPTLKAEFEGKDPTYVGASEDGEAVAFSVAGTLYLHRDGMTIGIAESPAAFAGVSEDGTWVFYAAGGGLYACDTEGGPCAGPSAHSPETIVETGIFAEVSAKGTHAFFSSSEVLPDSGENENEEEAELGAHNLYDWDGTEVHFISRLSGADFEQKAFADIGGMNFTAWTRALLGFGALTGRAYTPTRSTPDGAVFVFQSHARLTAYDNEGIAEIYRYDPAATKGARLLCVSCDPSGAPPSHDALLEDIRPINLPLQPKTMVANVTDDGRRVFFQSFDALLPEDANEEEDVYEWQAQGAGGCNRAHGCLALISSGQGDVSSFLYAMSADGRDVFFQTKEKLVGADVVGSPSIYDARVGGGIPELETKEPCQGDACQGQGSEPPSLPSPATIGAGEGGKPSLRIRCAKGKRRIKGRCVAVKHRHRKHRHRRVNAKGRGNR